MTTSGPTPTAVRWDVYEPGPAGRTVRECLEPIQRGYVWNDEAWAVARLAQLRRGAGKAPEEVPELFGLIDMEALYTPEGRVRGCRHGPAAVHLAVTLYALHQQSRRTDPMHVPGRRFGGAVRALMPEGKIDETLRRRFVRVTGATSANVLAYRLRELVLLLRRAGKPLDYARLADQIEKVLDPARRLRARQEWGREFHAWRPPKDTEDEHPTNDGGSPATGHDSEEHP